MNPTQILQPVPLAFLVFPFTFAMQVMAQSELVGVIPYVLLTLSAGFVFIKAALAKKVRWGSHGTSGIDFFINFFLLFSAVHIAMGLLVGGEMPREGLRAFLVYVASAWVYFYVSRYAREKEIRAVMLAIAIAAVIVALHWIYATYTRTILEKVTDFQLIMHEYIKLRNNFTDDQVNTSVLGTQYRAYGLLDKHTTTGAIVAIGAFGTFALFPRISQNKKMLLLGGFWLALSIGLATTAWISYVLLLPAVLALSETRCGRAWKILIRFAIYLCIGTVALLVVFSSMPITRQILSNSLELLALQFSFLMNFDPMSDQVSWFWLYYNELSAYFQFAIQKPLALVFGEGIYGYGDVTYNRGGDLALLEFVAAYGIPTVLLFFSVVMAALVRSVKALKNPQLTDAQAMYLIFSFAVLVFLVLSLAHYNTLFNKAVIVFLYLALALIRRYGYRLPDGGNVPNQVAGQYAK
jgi:hypothetical protein